jgi:zinc transporter ZupT
VNSSVLFVGLAFLLALIGAVLASSIGRSHKRLCALISLGAGSLLGVTVCAILPESRSQLNWWALLLALASGYLLFFLVTKYVFHVCPACAASHFDEATTHRFGEIAAGMMIALSIHCIADGLAIAAGQEEELVRTAGGRALAFSLIVAICVHKVPEGLALGSLLLGAGFAQSGMLLRVVAVEATTIVGGIAGIFFLRHISPVWLAAVVAHAGGGFLFLAIHAVFGEIFHHHKAVVLTNFAAGFGLILIITMFFHFH